MSGSVSGSKVSWEALEASGGSNSQVSTFNFNNTNSIRVVTIEGNPWFVAKEVCEVLGFPLVSSGGYPVSPAGYLKYLDQSEKEVVSRHKLPKESFLRELFVESGRSGTPRTIIISESGLYKLVMRSFKPEAKAFQDWVTKVVLPSIPESSGARARTACT